MEVDWAAEVDGAADEVVVMMSCVSSGQVKTNGVNGAASAVTAGEGGMLRDAVHCCALTWDWREKPAGLFLVWEVSRF